MRHCTWQWPLTMCPFKWNPCLVCEEPKHRYSCGLWRGNSPTRQWWQASGLCPLCTQQTQCKVCTQAQIYTETINTNPKYETILFFLDIATSQDNPRTGTWTTAYLTWLNKNLPLNPFFSHFWEDVPFSPIIVHLNCNRRADIFLKQVRNKWDCHGDSYSVFRVQREPWFKMRSPLRY